MEEIVKNAVDLAKVKGASYADCRVIERKEEEVSVIDGRVSPSSREDLGIGVRVIVDCSWGFASSSRIDEVDSVVSNAISIARASSLVKKGAVFLSEEATIVASYKTPYKINPFDVSLEKKVNILLLCDNLMSKNPKIKRREGSIYSFFERKFFANSGGSFITQEIIYCGGGITCNAVENNEVQTRSYPNNFGGDFSGAGFEFIEKLDLSGNAERIAEEAIELLSSEKCPSGNWTIILDNAQLALQLHESIGHPIELDRVLGTEAAYAGESFLTLDKLDGLRYGSPIVNAYQDATIPGGLGTFGYDDEGVPAQRTPVIKDGMFVGYLTSRETAPVIGKKSNGCMRADGWNRIPLIRMTNINLEPGNCSFDELIADTDNGFFLETNKCWSIDNRRLNFQFATERAIGIKNGKFCGVYKNPVYTGITPEFWASCDAICNKDYWHIFGLPNCGKGQPAQRMFVGHGVSPARFRNVRML